MNTTAATAYPQLQPPISACAPVLANRPLRPYVDLAGTSTFGQDTWLLTPALHQLHNRSLCLDFLTIPAQFRDVCKELFYALLTLDLPPGVQPCHIVSIRGCFSRVKEFLIWADAREATTLHSLTEQDFVAWGEHVAAQRIGEVTRQEKQRVARLFWLFRAKLSSDSPALDPALVLGEPYRHPIPRSGTDNATHRVPETVLAPLLTWALRWVESFAADILHVHQDLPHPSSAGQAPPEPASARPRAHLRLADVLDQYRRQQHGLPGRRAGLAVTAHRPGRHRTVHTVNVTYLARQARCNVTTLYREPCRSMLHKAAIELGVDDDTYLNRNIRGHVDGQPWLAAIRYDDIEHLTRMLQTACYVVIAYLSGMRDSEIKHMVRGCLSSWRDETGKPLRHKVTSLAFKGEDTVHGVQATWIVNGSVACAVQVLQQLQPPSQPLLFAVPPTSRGYGKSKANPVKTSHSTNRDLAAFVGWVNHYCAQHGIDEVIPDVNGSPWRLMTRQFRRTLAWFIARQPGGVIAGAIQYRHLRVQMFEGYAGTSASGFRQEVEAEQAIQRGEKLADLIGNPVHRQLTGPAAEQAHARLAAFQAHVQFHGKVIPDRKRLERLIRRHDPNIHPGQYVTCVYNPDRALCRRHDNGSGPSLPDCQLLACRNVALTHDNIDALTDWLATIDRTLHSGDTLAPYLRDRIRRRRDDVARFLTANQPPVEEAP